MKYIFGIFVAIFITLNINCSSEKYLSLDQIRYDISNDSTEVLNVDSLAIVSYAPNVLRNDSIYFKDKDFILPVTIHNALPLYPKEAIENKIEGRVWLKMYITKNGNVRRSVVIKTSNSLFNVYAMMASIQWHFLPARENGKAVDCWVSIPFDFKLYPRN